MKQVKYPLTIIVNFGQEVTFKDYDEFQEYCQSADDDDMRGVSDHFEELGIDLPDYLNFGS